MRAACVTVLNRHPLRLPNHFAGRSLSQGAARVLIEATVKDHAGHSETRGEPITVSDSPLLVTAIPEGGTLIPELDNQVFVLTSYPDGTPAQADIRVECKGNPDQTVHTDSGGVAILQIRGKLNRQHFTLRRVIETRDLDIVNGQAAEDIPVSPSLAGAIEINAYLFGPDVIPVSDRRLIFVQPAGELKIETALDCPTYKPGDKAGRAGRVGAANCR